MAHSQSMVTAIIIITITIRKNIYQIWALKKVVKHNFQNYKNTQSLSTITYILKSGLYILTRESS